jgi:hypothetical protein
LIIIALGNNASAETAEGPDRVVTSLEAAIEAVRNLKADGVKPQARPE